MKPGLDLLITTHNLLLFSFLYGHTGLSASNQRITDTGKTPRREFFFGNGNGVLLDMFSSLPHHPITDLHGIFLLFSFVLFITSFHKTLLTT